MDKSEYIDPILIIDDEVQIRRLLEITLSASGLKFLKHQRVKKG
jgi:hypothetical protein